MSARVLMLSERYPPDLGGVARSAARTVGQLANLGLSCDVFTWTKTLPPGQLTTDSVNVGETEQTIHRLGLFANLDFSLQHTMNVLEWLHDEHAFDLVWGHYLYPAGFVAAFLAGRLGVPCTVSARGNDVDRLMFPPGDFARLTWTLRSADLVTSVSQDLAAKLAQLEPAANVRVIRNTVDTVTFSPGEGESDLRARLGIYPQETVLGFCGELRQKKGLPFLLEAFREVRAHRPACLLVIGEVRERDKTLLGELLQDDADARKRVLVTGRIDDPAEVARAFRLCDVVLSPSVWDGLPNAILEAMACERFVIASDAGGIPEVIEHGQHGVLLPKSQLHRLGEATLEVLALPESQRKRLQSQARQRVCDAFAPRREAAELEQLLSDLELGASNP